MKVYDPIIDVWRTYLYVTNLQGDIVRVIDPASHATAVSYEYDAWGRVITKSSAYSDYAALYLYNPLTYRGYIAPNEEVVLHQNSENKNLYSFDYDGNSFDAEYSVKHGVGQWRINDSYRIENFEDQVKICKQLINEHSVLGKDNISGRTAQDMAFEWKQHNIAYYWLQPFDGKWKEQVRNVDLDPKDQGRTVFELMWDRLFS